MIKADRIRLDFWVAIVHSIDLGGLDDHICADFGGS
jgi:hypothetical protein